MKIQVWDNGGITMDRYTIYIDKHEFLMSFYADRANEMNMYMGEKQSSYEVIEHLMKYTENTLLPKIPKNIKYAIRQRCKELRRENAAQ